MQKLKKSWKNYLSRSLTAVHCSTADHCSTVTTVLCFPLLPGYLNPYCTLIFHHLRQEFPIFSDKNGCSSTFVGFIPIFINSRHFRRVWTLAILEKQILFIVYMSANYLDITYWIQIQYRWKIFLRDGKYFLFSGLRVTRGLLIRQWRDTAGVALQPRAVASRGEESFIIGIMHEIEKLWH